MRIGICTARVLDSRSRAHALGLSLPHTASCAQMMNAATALGLGQRDSSALVQVLETLGAHRI